MATSTESTVRAVLVAAVQGIASDLGFNEPTGNVKDYPLEAHHPERYAAYLKALVGGKRRARAWAFDVRGHDEPFALRNISKRTYIIRCIGYYEQGEDGEGHKDLIDHATKVRGAIRTLTNNLSGTVDLISSATPLDIVDRRDIETMPLWVGTMTWTATRNNPDY